MEGQHAKLDSLDIKILKVLGETGPSFAGNPRTSLRAMARKLGVDKDTVSRRLKKFQEKQVLNGWAVMVNPNLVGAETTRLLLELPERSNKDDVVRKLKLIPGVVLITTLYGDAIVFIIYYNGEQSLKKTIELVSRISNAESITRIDSSFPPCRLVLSKTDWKLIRSVQKEPLKSYSQISREVGISAKTAKRRLARLLGGFALGAYPRFNPSPLDATTVELVAFYDESKAAGEANGKILERFGDKVMMSDLSDKTRGYFILFVNNAREVHDISTWVRGLPGVLKCRADIALDHIEVPDALSEILDRRAQEILTQV